MVTYSRVVTQIPVVDLKRALRFYTETLGIRSIPVPIPGLALLECSGSQLMMYQREPTKADHTIAAFVVDNIEATVKELKKKGIVFEQYALPNGIKTDSDGIATMGPAKAAWFKDTEGNLLALNNKMM